MENTSITKNGIEHLPQEVEHGNIEYKRQLINLSDERLQNLITQLKWRLFEGNGEAIYEIGVEDNGTPIGISEENLDLSIENLSKMASALNCEIKVVCKRPGMNGFIAEVLVREIKQEKWSDVRIAVCGNVDSGKSTLIGVLTTSQLDNGRGLSRVVCFNHPHELVTGRTSSIGNRILGFNSSGDCVNDLLYQNEHNISTGDIIDQSYKVITFLDLCGHERYVPTTISGLTGGLPDYCLLVIGGNMGVTKMTREHLKLILSFRIPLIVIITKIDITPPHILQKTLSDIKLLLKQANKTSLVIQNEEEWITSVKNIQNQILVPIFKVSSVTGENFDQLKNFFNMLTPRIQWELLKDKPAEFLIDSIFTITGVGTVVTGIVLSGTISTNDELFLGPDKSGNFTPVKIKSIQTNHMPRSSVSAGQSAGFALKKVKRSQVRKGMVLSAKEINPVSTWSFEAEIVVLHHSTSIKIGYEPIIQCMKVRQSARIVNIKNQKILRTGSKANVVFQFLYSPEYIKEGMRIILREGNCKAIGVISKVHPSKIYPEDSKINDINSRKIKTKSLKLSC